MENFRDRYGLGWQKDVDPSQSSERGASTKRDIREDVSTAAQGLQEALVFHSRPFLEVLRTSPQKTARLFDVAEKINIKVDVAIPVEKYLLKQGYVTRVKESKLGNDVLMLTDAGEMRLAP